LKITSIKGFVDILPGEVEIWQLAEETAREVFALYNFSEIRIPIVEKTELYSRSLGETTDIVEKEMYTFPDQDAKGSLLTLRPEGTAGVVRAYVEGELYQVEPVRRLFISARCSGASGRRRADSGSFIRSARKRWDGPILSSTRRFFYC